MRNYVASLALLMLGFVGCVGPDAKQARVSSLTGAPDGITVKTTQDGLFNVHGVRASGDGDDFTVSGHVGPPARWTGGPTGHVDVQIVAPDGKVVASGSAPLEPVSASPRMFVERRFRLTLPASPPAGSALRVTYHPGNLLACRIARD